MANVEFSKDGSEHFTATLRECLEDIQQRGEYLLYDGDLYWRPTTMLRVHTPQWLSFEGTVTWWRPGKRDPLEGGVGAVAVGRALMSQRFVLVEATSLPAVYQHNVL